MFGNNECSTILKFYTNGKIPVENLKIKIESSAIL